ncbi:MAG: KpsF/GutQ family sugar-phosphate isomerase [Alphaproteobacteria bacterium]|nr:KpsF/GutQ family sugar-phosphate isomerase [Alphaproteobacteria bacterium]
MNTANETSPVASALRTLRSYQDGVNALADLMRGELAVPFKAATDLLLASPGRLIVSGMGKSGHIGRKIAATFASTGKPAYFVHPSEASHGDLGMIAPQDAILALSWSGETAELGDLIAYSKRFRIALISVTSNTNSTLAKASDVVLALPKVVEACPHNLAPTTSSMLQLAIGDALAVALLEGCGFSPVDFGNLHPGGRLGAALKFVRDVMHPRAETPIIAKGTGMSAAIVEMSSKGFGCVGIVDAAGALVGIVTDGDLRRHMDANLLGRTVDDIMTRNPKTIRSDVLASEALRVLNTSKVGALIVVDADKPIGIIRLHDILRAGIA